MIIARPTVTEERWLTLAGRYTTLRPAAEKTGLGGSWKTTTWLGRCLGFLLGLLGTGMLAGVLFAFPSPLLVGGLLLMIAAEWLVAQRRVFRSGMEEAVYLCGAIAVVAQLVVWIDGNHDALGCALVATAVLLVGWRLLNPLFTTLAVAGYSLAIASMGGSLFGGGMHTFEAGVACAVFAALALALGSREWRRPAHDRMLDGLVIFMPWLAHGWLTAYGWRGPNIAWLALAVALAFLVLNTFVGVRRRQHAPLIGALGNLVCVSYVAHRLVAWPLHWQLIVAGGLLLAAAVVVDRRLRARRDGLTSKPMDEPAGMELLQIAAAAHLTPAPGAAPEAGVQGHGGGFGGAGASGRF